MKSIFTPLQKEGLTTFKIRYDWKTGIIRYEAQKQWEQGQDFSRYNKDFFVQSILTDDTRFYNTNEVIELFKKYELYDYLLEVVSLIKKGRHFGMECYYNDKYNIRFMCNQHSRKLGALNKRQATLAGGIRRHGLEDEEIDVIIDGLNLGRAMSFKSVAADLDFGGSKTTVHMGPLDIDNMDMMGFIAYSIDSSRTMTGPDMKFPTAMADVMLSRGFTGQFNGGPTSPLGESGKPTAYGVYLAMKKMMLFHTGSESLDGLSIAVQGLGRVGRYLADHLALEKVTLLIADTDQSRVDRFIAEHPDTTVRQIDPQNILTCECDIFCPCAMGGIIHEDNVDQLRCKYIFGAANNQLKASSQEEEIAMAKLIAKRGIFFQADWWHNSAGFICGAEDHIKGLDADYGELCRIIENTVPRRTSENLERASQLGVTPTEAAYIYSAEKIYG